MAALLAQASQQSPRLEVLKKKVIDQAPKPLRAPEARPLMIRLLGGLVLWVTTCYCGPQARKGRGRGKEGSGLYPELAALGIDEGASPALVSLVGRMTALLPSYEVARDELFLRGLPLDVKVVHRMGRHLGAELLATRTRDLQAYRAGLMPVGQDLAGYRVGVAEDGGRVRTRIVIRKQKGRGKQKTRRRRFRVEWREPKLLIIFKMDERGRMIPGSRCWIDGTFKGPDELMELLAMHLHRLGAVQAQVVVFLSDGAPWIWERLEWVEKRVGLAADRVKRVLDWCHAVHHVSLALGKLGLDDAARRTLFKQMRRKVRAGQTEAVIADLRARAGPETKEKDSVWTEIRFLQKHALAGHMDYKEFRKAGVPIGSGAIESAIRRVINLRLKGNGLLWKEANAEGMIVLRAAALTRQWRETLEHVRESMASNRRLDWKWQSPDMPAQLEVQLLIGPPEPQVQAGQ